MRIDQTSSKGSGGMDHSHPRYEDQDMDDDETEEQEVIQQTTPIKSRNPPRPKLPPKTPRMDGMRGLFANPKAVPPTPVMGGIKQLFNEPAEPQTPVYVGVRDMFKPTVAPVMSGTPVLEGMRDLLDAPVTYHEQPPPPGLVEVSVETAIADSEMAIPGTKAAEAVRSRRTEADGKQPIGTTQPLKIGRPKKASKVSDSHGSLLSPDIDESLQESVSVPRPSKTKKVTDEGVSSTTPNVLNIILTYLLGTQKTHSRL